MQAFHYYLAGITFMVLRGVFNEHRREAINLVPSCHRPNLLLFWLWVQTLPLADQSPGWVWDVILTTTEWGFLPGPSYCYRNNPLPLSFLYCGSLPAAMLGTVALNARVW